MVLLLFWIFAWLAFWMVRDFFWYEDWVYGIYGLFSTWLDGMDIGTGLDWTGSETTDHGVHEARSYDTNSQLDGYTHTHTNTNYHLASKQTSK